MCTVHMEICIDYNMNNKRLKRSCLVHLVVVNQNVKPCGLESGLHFRGTWKYQKLIIEALSSHRLTPHPPEAPKNIKFVSLRLLHVI